MKRFRDIFGHPHEPVVCGGRSCALCRKVAISLYGIAETKWERCRGALDEVFWREWLPSGKLRHDVGEREGEVA